MSLPDRETPGSWDKRDPESSSTVDGAVEALKWLFQGIRVLGREGVRLSSEAPVDSKFTEKSGHSHVSVLTGWLICLSSHSILIKVILSD